MEATPLLPPSLLCQPKTLIKHQAVILAHGLGGLRLNPILPLLMRRTTIILRPGKRDTGPVLSEPLTISIPRGITSKRGAQIVKHLFQTPSTPPEQATATPLTAHRPRDNHIYRRSALLLPSHALTCLAPMFHIITKGRLKSLQLSSLRALHTGPLMCTTTHLHLHHHLPTRCNRLHRPTTRH